jgi:tetratricopeptide (TPR) repeat protein
MQPGTQGSSTLSPEQSARVHTIVDELLDLPQQKRAAALSRISIDDSAVAAAVERWLEAEHASSDFMSTSPRTRLDEHPPDPSVGLRLGAWRLTRLIGRGGMGDVYEGLRISGDFEQRVAVKLLQRETAGESKRFQTERQILARLDHAGIARLYDGGVTDDSRLYMVMEYVEGRPITEFCTLRAAPLSQRLGLFIRVCEAVAYAHRNHVIHRDLKPSNILVTGEGAVKLLDFGIAQFLDAQIARITQAVPAMSPICAAPEQLMGHDTSVATDVYSLGLLLFELLTGTHPWMHHNTSILQAMRTILELPAPLASAAAEARESSPIPARRIRGDLDAIVAKTLRKEPRHRYSTVDALKSDVIRFLRGEPVEARKHAHLYRAWHTLRRYRWSIGAVLAAALMFGVAVRMMPRQIPQAAPGAVVALVGFGNLSRQEAVSWLPAALVEMLGTELSSTDKLRAVPQELVLDITQGQGNASSTGRDPDALRKLGRQLNADYIVTGNLLAASAAGDSSLRIDMSLQDVRKDLPMVRFSQQASMNDLPELVSKIGVILRGKMGVPSPTSDVQAQITNALPPSVDVAKKMSLASEAMQHYDAAKARDELLQVIAQSPGYAPAYASLADAWSALGYREKAVAAAQQAQTRGSGLPTEMRLQIDAALQSATYQWSKASDDWNSLIKLRPNDPEYRLQALQASLAAGLPGAAQAVLAELRRLPGAAQDPRVELAAAKLACALDDSKSCAQEAQEALRLALVLGGPGVAAEARDQLGSAMMHLGNLDSAGENLRAAVDSYHAIGNLRGESEARRKLGRVLIDQHHDEQGRAEYQRAMATAQGIGDLGGVSAVYRDFCELLWEDGDRDGAQAAAKSGLELSRETGDLKLQAWTLRALATIASDESASDEVMRDYREVTTLTERSGDRGGHVWSLATNAEMMRLRGDMTEARATCVQALSEASRLSDPQFLVYSTYTCALVELDGGHSDTAVAMLEQVERASEASNNSIYLANAGLTLAQIDMEQGHCDKALIKLGKAVEGFVQTETKTGQAEAEALRATCYQQIGNAQQRDTSLASARSLRAAITSRLEIYSVDIVAAQLGFAEGRHSDAIAKLNSIAADAAHRHWLRWSMEAQFAAWRMAAINGDRTSAQRLRKKLQESAQQHDMGRILARIQIT